MDIVADESTTAKADDKVEDIVESEAALAARYGAMDLEERAYNILYDLGMIDETPDPDSEDYDSSKDDELVI